GQVRYRLLGPGERELDSQGGAGQQPQPAESHAGGGLIANLAVNRLNLVPLRLLDQPTVPVQGIPNDVGPTENLHVDVHHVSFSFATDNVWIPPRTGKGQCAALRKSDRKKGRRT